MQTEIEQLTKRILGSKRCLSSSNKLFFDVSASFNWIRSGCIIGISRTCIELYISLKKIINTELVVLKSKNDLPALIRVDPDTLNLTDEILIPKNGDIIFTPEFQIRGIHVSRNHPTVQYFKKFGVTRCALIYDILPITHPTYFEKETARKTPDYLLNIFKNYNKIICISKTVMDSVKNFYEFYKIRPYDLEICFNKNIISNECECNGFKRRKNFGVIDKFGSSISFFSQNTSTDYSIEIDFNSKLSKYSSINIYVNGVLLNSFEISKKYHKLRANIKKEYLNVGGLQLIKIEPSYCSKKTFLKKSAILFVNSIKINAMLRDSISISNTITEKIDIDYAYLGVSNLTIDNSNQANTYESFFSSNKTFLMVGTIEPRKRHSFVLDVFDKLWSQGFDCKLCIVGKIGWNVDSYVSRLKTHPLYGDKLIFIENASDKILSYAYKNSCALIQASVDEGFGLPIIEALSNNLKVICSNIDIFKEVASNNAIFFDSTSKVDLYKKIKLFIEKKIDYKINRHSYINLSWDKSATALLNLLCDKKGYSHSFFPSPLGSCCKLKKILVLNTFPVYPAISGGQVRIFNLYKHLAKHFEVELLCFNSCFEQPRQRTLSQNFVEIALPISYDQYEKEQELNQKSGVGTADITFMLHGNSTINQYLNLIEQKINLSDLIVFSHPYTFNVFKMLIRGKPFIYESHNVESKLKEYMYPKNDYFREVLKSLFECEKECSELSLAMTACSKLDAELISNLYNIKLDKINIVPNGVDCSNFPFISIDDRLQNKEKADILNQKIGFFIGSGHLPNVKAALDIISLAESTPTIVYIIAGGVCDALINKKITKNVSLIGFINESQKKKLLSCVDFAINTVKTGSGTNLKMFDYMASGVPIFTTSCGMRGIDGKNYCIQIDENLHDAIINFNLLKTRTMIENARNIVNTKYDWKIIAKTYSNLINKILNNINS